MMEQAILKHDQYLAAELSGMSSLERAGYAHQHSLSCVLLALECIRRTDAVLADLACVWISQETAQFRYQRHNVTE